MLFSARTLNSLKINIEKCTANRAKPVQNMTIAHLFAMLLSTAVVAWAINQYNLWQARRARVAELDAVKYMRIPPKFASETPGDRTVMERAESFKLLLLESGNKWFSPADVRIYIYRGFNNRPDDSNGYGLSFETWQEQVESDYRQYKAEWAEGQARKGQTMSDAAKAQFANQRGGNQFEWGQIIYNAK